MALPDKINVSKVCGLFWVSYEKYEPFPKNMSIFVYNILHTIRGFLDHLDTS